MYSNVDLYYSVLELWKSIKSLILTCNTNCHWLFHCGSLGTEYPFLTIFFNSCCFTYPTCMCKLCMGNSSCVSEKWVYDKLYNEIFLLTNVLTLPSIALSSHVVEHYPPATTVVLRTELYIPTHSHCSHSPEPDWDGRLADHWGFSSQAKCAQASQSDTCPWGDLGSPTAKSWSRFYCGV